MVHLSGHAPAKIAKTSKMQPFLTKLLCSAHRPQMYIFRSFTMPWSHLHTMQWCHDVVAHQGYSMLHSGGGGCTSNSQVDESILCSRSAIFEIIDRPYRYRSLVCLTRAMPVKRVGVHELRGVPFT